MRSPTFKKARRRRTLVASPVFVSRGERLVRRNLPPLTMKKPLRLDKLILSDCLNIEDQKVGSGKQNSDEIEIWYRQHGAALLLFAYTMSGDRGRAQDALHQVFLKLIENGGLSRATDKKAYLFACVRNAVLNERKLEERQALLDRDAAWFSPPEDKRCFDCTRLTPRFAQEDKVLR